jgi:hydrogenase/urease accessory protein HupE
MAANKSPQLDRWSFRFLLFSLGVAAMFLLTRGDWFVPSADDARFWNAFIAFMALGIASDSSFLPLPRIPTARLGSSVVFVPFLAAVLLFSHPWPLVIAGITGLVSQVAIRRK